MTKSSRPDETVVVKYDGVEYTAEVPSTFREDMECQNCMCQRWEDHRIPLTTEMQYFTDFTYNFDGPIGPADVSPTEKCYTKELRPVRYALRCADCGHEQEHGKPAQEVILIISRDPRHHWLWEMDRIHQMGLHRSGELKYSERELTIELGHQEWFFMHTRSDRWRGLNFTSYEARDVLLPERLEYELQARMRR